MNEFTDAEGVRVERVLSPYDGRVVGEMPISGSAEVGAAVLSAVHHATAHATHRRKRNIRILP